jgi:hypothetical protein
MHEFSPAPEAWTVWLKTILQTGVRLSRKLATGLVFGEFSAIFPALRALQSRCFSRTRCGTPVLQR